MVTLEQVIGFNTEEEFLLYDAVSLLKDRWIFEFGQDLPRLIDSLEVYFFESIGQEFCGGSNPYEKRDEVHRKFVTFLNSKTPDEILSDLVMMEETLLARYVSKDSRTSIYDTLRETYVTIVDEFDQYSRSAGFIQREVLPTLAPGEIPQLAFIRALLEKYQDDDAFGGLLKIAKKTKEEISAYCGLGKQYDIVRRKLHEHLVKQGALCGLTEDEVLYDIVFHTNSEDWHVHYDPKKKVITRKVGILDLSSGLLPECVMNDSRWSKEWQEEVRKGATKVLEEYRAGKTWLGKYKSDNHRESSEEQDRQRLELLAEELRREVPEGDYKIDLSLYLSFHGRLIFGLALKADTSRLNEESIAAVTKIISAN